jgi:IMP dehydrogenase
MSKSKKVSLSRKCDAFFKEMGRLALTYSDVRVQTCYSEVLPKDAILFSRFSRNIGVNTPIISSPMDTVTEAAMLIAMPENGGLGIVHKNLLAKDQASAVQKAKHRLSAFISDPICVKANQTVKAVLEFITRKGYQFHSFPVLDSSGKVVGVVTSRNFRFAGSAASAKKISSIMARSVISARDGTDIHKAHEIMMQKQIKILPVFDRQEKLLGIYTLADVERIVNSLSPEYNLAPDGTLRVGAAIGVGDDARERMELLAKARVDVVVIDTAHGNSKGVVEAVKFCKRNYPHIDVVAGNVSEPDGARRLARAGADGIRVGQGPGSICTTRIIAGVGCPQVTAVYKCAKILRGSGVPVCADGGIENSGDISVAIAAGADTVMLGKILAGTTESPGDVIPGPGNTRVKVYRGMGSLSAMKENKASAARYGQAEKPAEKLVPEGVETRVPFKGDVSNILYQLLGGLRAGMGYCGTKTIVDLQMHGDFNQITRAGLEESHPHGIGEFEKTPNYGG